jgi:hypothetical protein
MNAFYGLKIPLLGKIIFGGAYFNTTNIFWRQRGVGTLPHMSRGVAYVEIFLDKSLKK